MYILVYVETFVVPYGQSFGSFMRKFWQFEEVLTSLFHVFLCVLKCKLICSSWCVLLIVALVFDPIFLLVCVESLLQFFIFLARSFVYFFFIFWLYCSRTFCWFIFLVSLLSSNISFMMTAFSCVFNYVDCGTLRAVCFIWETVLVLVKFWRNLTFKCM